MGCLTSAVSCRWASFAAPKCWVSSSFSKACWEHSRKWDTPCLAVSILHILTKATIVKKVQPVSRFDKDKWFRTSLTFFWRSTICERRCVISSCCREASSLFRASSSDRDVICRLELPGMTEGIQIGSKDLLLMGDLMSLLPGLTQFFDTVVDKLLLLFLIRDCFCLQVTRLMQNKQVGMTHCIMLINNPFYKIAGVDFRSFFLWETITGLIKTRPATPLFSETSLGKIPGASLHWHFYARIDL